MSVEKGSKEAPNQEHFPAHSSPAQTQIFSLERGRSAQNWKKFWVCFLLPPAITKQRNKEPGDALCLSASWQKPQLHKLLLCNNPQEPVSPEEDEVSLGLWKQWTPPTSESTVLHKCSWKAYDCHFEGWHQKGGEKKKVKYNNIFVSHYSFY